ncbi:MAG: MopE-related protein, partial [Myxococcaceae bacterium]
MRVSPSSLPRLKLVAFALVTLVGCAKTPIDQAAIRVNVAVRAPVDCVRVTASDEHVGPASTVELPVDSAPTDLVVAIYRREEWGLNAVIFASGLKGGCTSGIEVSRSELAHSAFGTKDKVPVVNLTLTGTDSDQDGYVAQLPDGTPFDCDDTAPSRHPNATEACESNLDLDCDGKLGCQRGSCLGKKDASGLRCCPSGASTTTETQCNDGVDNDCDGLSDCADSDCAGKTCDANGRSCVSLNTCACPGNATVESACNDGIDNDCDGLVDCADRDCTNRSCGAGVCRGVTCCAATTDGGTVVTPERCGDGKVDCADPLCAGSACNGFGSTCSNNQCVCPNGTVEGIASGQCSDRADNDCDGKIDCDDTSCSGLTCATGKTCQAGQCACALSEPTEASCADGADNDCDGLIDCADPNCAGKSCSASGGVCTGASCVCSASTTESSCSNGADDNCNGA